VTAHAVDLAWEATGDVSAPVLVLCHALGTDRSMWEPQLDALRASYRVFRVDLRAHGASPVPEGPYSVEQIANDVLRAVDAAGLRRFHYCGVSLGGMIGLLLAARHPERISALVAANTAAKIGTEERWQERCHAVRSLGMKGICDTVVPRWFAPDFASKADARIERMKRVFVETHADGYLACCAALGTADLTAEVSRIRAPTLIIGGEHDASTSVADAEALHASIDDSQLLVLEGAGHLSNIDRSEDFTAAVRDFLGDLAPPRKKGPRLSPRKLP
jgi:3-oxoadipate enol-lactonase